MRIKIFLKERLICYFKKRRKKREAWNSNIIDENEEKIIDEEQSTPKLSPTKSKIKTNFFK